METATKITETLVAELITQQFPQWADLPVRAVTHQGWDNRTYRLGNALSARLPSAQPYEAAVQKESQALAFLDGKLPVMVPAVAALGEPGDGYPYQWSVRRWLDGITLDHTTEMDRHRFASDLGAVLRGLRSLPTHAGVVAGQHSFYRGCHPSVYGDQVQAALQTLRDEIDIERCEQIWAAATRTAWGSDPVWFHGDLAASNLLTQNGALSALLDFGTCGIGDPACDLVIAWTYFDSDTRDVFREAAGLDDGTWDRARGWALWKALVTISSRTTPYLEETQRHALTELLAE